MTVAVKRDVKYQPTLTRVISQVLVALQVTHHTHTILVNIKHKQQYLMTNDIIVIYKPCNSYTLVLGELWKSVGGYTI